MANGEVSYKLTFENQQAIANIKAMVDATKGAASSISSAISQINSAFASVKGPQISISSTGLSGLQGQASQAQSALNGLGQAASTAGSAVTGAGNAAGSAVGGVNSFHNAWSNLRSVLAFEIGKEVAMEFVHMADEATQASNRIQAATKTQGEANAVWAQLIKTAQETRQPLERTAEDFQQVTVATNALGLSYRDQIGLTKELNQLLVVSGASGQRAKAGIGDLLRGLAAGRITSAEIKGMVHDVPQLGEAIAKGLGVGIGSLRELAKEGKLTAKEVVPALQKVGPEIEATFAKMTPTIAGGFQVIKTGVLDMIHDFNDGTGILSGFSNGLVFLGEHIHVLAGGLAGIAAVLIAQAIPAMIEFTATLLANPITIIAVGIAAAGAAIAAFGDRTYTVAGQTVTGWQVVKATFQTIGDYIGTLASLFTGSGETMKSVTQAIGQVVNEVWSTIIDVTKSVVNTIVGLWVGEFALIREVWNNFPGVMDQIFTAVINLAVSAGEAVLNAWQAPIRGIAALASTVAPNMASTINGAMDAISIKLPRAKLSQAGAQAGQDVGKAFKTAMNTDYVGNFADGVTSHLKTIAEEAKKTKAALDDVHGGMASEEAEKKKKKKGSARDPYGDEVKKLQDGIYDAPLNKDQQGLVDAMDSAGLEHSITATGKLADNIRKLVGQLQTANKAREFRDELDKLNDTYAKLNLTEEQVAQMDARKAANLPTDLKVVTEQTKAIDAQAAAISRLQQKQKDQKALEGLGASLGKANSQHQAKNDEMKNPQDAALTKNLEKIKEQRAQWERILADAKSLTAEERAQYQTQIDSAVKDEEADARKQDALDKTQKITDFMTQMYQNPQQAMNQFFQSMIQQLLMSIAKATILKGLLGSTGSSGGGIGSMIMKAFGGGKAVGGDVSSSNYYMVGENGPELFAPGKSGTIIPNHNLQGGGGGNVTVGGAQIVIHGNADSSTHQQMAYALAQHEKKVVQLIRRENARN